MNGGSSPALRLLRLLGVVGGLSLVAFVAVEWSYYALPATERPHHPGHGALRPSGSLGLLFGISGTALMALSMIYLVRKRLAHWTWLGSLQSWVGFHILTGLLGPGLIVLHAAFHFKSSLATLSFAAMLLAVLAGTLGWIVHSTIPRSLEGKEIELSEVRRRLEITFAKLRALGVHSRLLEITRNHHGFAEEPVGPLGSLAEFVRGEWRVRREYRELRRQILASERLRPAAGKILPVVQRLCRERRWFTCYHQLRQLTRLWRFFHRWLAVVLFFLVLFHVLLALRFGNLWILREAP